MSIYSERCPECRKTRGRDCLQESAIDVVDEAMRYLQARLREEFNQQIPNNDHIETLADCAYNLVYDHIEELREKNRTT